MAKNYDSLVNGVVDLVGGKDNVEFFTHCVTRLRFNVKDQSKVDTASIEKLDGVFRRSMAKWTTTNYHWSSSR